MKYVVVQFKDGTKKVVPRRWVYAKDVFIHKKYPIFFATNISKMAPEDPAMLQRYQNGDKSGFLHTVYVLSITDSLAEATQKLQVKRIAVKPLKIQTDSDEVISQLIIKKPKKDTKKLQHTAAKHQNELYLTEFVSANSSANTNLEENMIVPLGTNKSMARTSSAKSMARTSSASKTTPTPSKDQEDKAPENFEERFGPMASQIRRTFTSESPSVSSVSLGTKKSMARTSSASKTTPTPSEDQEDKASENFEERFGQMASQISRIFTSESPSVSSSDSEACTPEQNRQHHSSPKLSIGSKIIKDATTKLGKSTKVGKSVGERNMSLSRRDDDTFRHEKNCSTSQHKLLSKNRWAFTPIRRPSLLVTRETSQRTSILSSSYQSKGAGPSPDEESLGDMASQMSRTSTSDSSLHSVPCTPGQGRQHNDSKKLSTGSEIAKQAKKKLGKHVGDPVGDSNISRSRRDDDTLQQKNRHEEIYPTSQHSQNHWTPLRRTSLLVTRETSQLLFNTATVETAKRQKSKPDRMKSTPPVAEESTQMRFRAEITDEVFVQETESLDKTSSETGNCKNCEAVQKRLENLQKRLEKSESKNQVLTELNLNLQVEKVKLLAQNNEKAPFVNKVADFLSPEIVLRIHMECAAGSDGDGRFISGVADHLWSKRQIIERSVKGKNCNLHPESGSKQPATPSKVSFIVEKLTQRVDLEGDLEPKRKIPSRVSRKLNEKMSNARRRTLDL